MMIAKLISKTAAAACRAYAQERVRMHSIENAQIFAQWQNDFFSNKTSQEAEVDSYFLA
jgi:hypothetical protein